MGPPMLNVALPLIFLLVSWSVGLGFYKFFPRPKDISITVTPVLGFAILVVFTSYSYQFGIQTDQIGLVIYVLSTFFLIWQLNSIRVKSSILRLKESVTNVFSVFGILTIGYLLLVYPAVIGGTNFKIFQGNHWDSLSYMGITQSITSHSFYDLTTNSGITLIDPVTTLATSSMRARPNVEIILASILAPFDLSILDYSYSFAIFLTLILGCGMWALFDYFKPKNSGKKVVLSVFLISAFLVGFWGQYLIDINAWSSAAAIPLMIGIFVWKSAWLLKTDLQRGLVLGIFLVSSILIYPESFLFFSPLIFLFAVFTIRRNGIRFTVNLQWYVLLYSLVFLLLLTSKYQPLMFGISQLKFGSSDASAPWGPYFQAYLGGDQGLSYSSGLNFIRTIPSGLLGLYFLSPTELASSNPKDILILILNCVLIYAFISIIVRLIKFARASSIGLITLLGMGLVPALKSE